MSDRKAELERILAAAAPGIAAHWDRCRKAGLKGMEPANTGAVDAAISAFFDRLKALPESSEDALVLAQMQRLYVELDAINDRVGHGLLETHERELLVTVFIDAAQACGVDPDDYDGEPGGEYRNF